MNLPIDHTLAQLLTALNAAIQQANAATATLTKLQGEHAKCPKSEGEPLPLNRQKQKPDLGSGGAG